MTLRANRAAYERVTFQPRILRDVSIRSSHLSLFGTQYDLPSGIAPMGFSSPGRRP